MRMRRRIGKVIAKAGINEPSAVRRSITIIVRYHLESAGKENGNAFQDLNGASVKAACY